LFKVKRGIGTNGHVNGDVNGHATTNGTNGVAVNGGASVKAPPYPYATEAEPENPTVVPFELLSKFHFTFLIRDPHYSIPSYYRCTIPPLDDVTGFHEFSPSEAGYDEVRRVFEYLRKVGLIGPRVATPATTNDGADKRNGLVDHQHRPSTKKKGVEICVVDADDLLDNPSLMIETYCKSVGIPFEPEMLTWDSEEDHVFARAAFEKWKGFHDDAIASKELKARTHVSSSCLLILPSRIRETNHRNYRASLSNPRKNSTPSGARNSAKRAPRSFGRRSIATWQITIT
jgi:Sulfotransferase domain